MLGLFVTQHSYRIFLEFQLAFLNSWAVSERFIVSCPSHSLFSGPFYFLISFLLFPSWPCYTAYPFFSQQENIYTIRMMLVTLALLWADIWQKQHREGNIDLSLASQRFQPFITGKDGRTAPSLVAGLKNGSLFILWLTWKHRKQVKPCWTQLKYSYQPSSTPWRCHSLRNSFPSRH